MLYAFSRRRSVTVVPRQAFLITTSVWVAAAAAGALPIVLHEHISLTDAFSDSMSGIIVIVLFSRAYWRG